jgi:hypothetical protein
MAGELEKKGKGFVLSMKAQSNLTPKKLHYALRCFLEQHPDYRLAVGMAYHDTDPIK